MDKSVQHICKDECSAHITLVSSIVDSTLVESNKRFFVWVYFVKNPINIALY